jgi:FkbM family methyltransferase|tara:strand:+ start:306 stop:1226 length:921 start_codon:yes stop_codon:yes gene_type:complete
MFKDNLISDTLHKIGKEVSNASVVQIGACDGISYDDTRGFLDLYKWKGVFVEPIPELFEQLKENFKDRDYKFVNAAITKESGKVIMLNVPEASIANQHIRPCFKGMSSVWPPKNGLGSDDEYDTVIRERFAKKIEVTSLSLEDLFKDTSTTEFDIFIVDAEGCDYDIFMQLDLNKYKPKFIRLETCNLTDKEREVINEKLKAHGYMYEEDDSDQNVDAVLESFWYGNDTAATSIDNINNKVTPMNAHLKAIKNKHEALRDIARADLEVYLTKQVAIGEHSDLGAEIEKKVEIIAHHNGVVETIDLI